MTRFSDPRILTPPREEEEIYPYRPVWRSLFLESAVLVVAVMLLFFFKEVIGLAVPSQILLFVNLGIALIPVVLWLAFSHFPERRVIAPRQHLLLVAIVSGLVASAIGYPLTKEFFQTELWLPLGTAIQRIIGFTLTFGIVDVSLKYLTVRYLVWPQYYRTRSDSIAYFAASSLGYSFVINLIYVTGVSPDYSIAAIFVLSTYSIHLASSLLLAYGLSEVYFSNTIPVFLPFIILSASIFTGITLPLRSGLINGALTISGSTDRPIFGIGFAIVVILIAFSLVSFLFNVAERQERETLTGQEE